jgi:hypothetical protein
MNFVIKAAFERSLRSSGFRKKGNSWYKASDATILVANLQRSSFSDAYYVNLGVWVKSMGDTDFPKEHQCHIRQRLCSLCDTPCKPLFDAEDRSMTDDERMAKIEALILEYAIPFLNDCSSTDGILRLFESNRLRGAMIRKDVRSKLAR